MGRLIYSASMSLDGFIAGADGDMSWLAEHLGPNPAVDELIGQTGALLVGNNTFGGDDPYRGREGEGEAFGGGWNGPVFVLTHRAPSTPVEGVTFVGDLDRGIAEAGAAAGDGYVNVPGADVARQCLEADALDEILVCITPVLLGDGVRLFHHPGGSTVRLEPIGQSATAIRLRVVR